MDNVYKEIVAIVRPERWSETKARLDALPISYSQRRVLGRVRERRLRYVPRNGARAMSIRYLPQRMIHCEVEDVWVDAVLQAILQVQGTGGPGGGRVFVLPVESVIELEPQPELSLPVPQTAIDGIHATWQ